MQRIEHLSIQLKVKCKKLIAKQHALLLNWVFLPLSSYTNFTEVSIGLWDSWKNRDIL